MKVLAFVTGDKKADRALRKLSLRNQRGVVNRAAKKGARPIAAQVRINARRHTKTGAMGKAVRVKKLKKGAGARVTIERRDLDVSSDREFYPAFVTLGWHSGKTRISISEITGNPIPTRKWNPGSDWMKRAARYRHRQAVKITAREIVKDIADIAKNA